MAAPGINKFAHTLLDALQKCPAPNKLVDLCLTDMMADMGLDGCVEHLDCHIPPNSSQPAMT